MYDDAVVCSYRRNCLRFMHVYKQMVGCLHARESRDRRIGAIVADIR